MPFLLENPAHYLELHSLDTGEVGDEIDLMNCITGSGHCGQLLDLHNLYCNAVNHGFDAYKALDRLALEPVTEIHVAAGAWRDGFLMDAHDNIVPQPVWDMLAYVLPRAPRVAGVLYEVLDRYVPKVGVAAMLRELERACRLGSVPLSEARGSRDGLIMSLHSFQTTLGCLIRARHADGALDKIVARLPLDDDQCAAFGVLLEGRGLAFTREVQRPGARAGRAMRPILRFPC